eukprot:g5822.t1
MGRPCRLHQLRGGPRKDVVQQLVNAPDANAPDATSLKEIFTTMNALNTFVNNVEKCDDKIGKLAGLDDEEKTTFGSYIGKIKCPGKKCLDYIKKTEEFKLDKGDCERTTSGTCSADKECISKECQGDCVCDENGIDECECHKNLDKFKTKVLTELEKK